MRERMALCAISALCTLLLATASEAATPARQISAYQAEPRPAIWKIADEDTTIYLFGTTHALPKGFRWQSPALKQIVAQADELVLETVDSPEADKKTGGAVDDTINPVVPDRPIAARVAPDKQALLKRAIARTDFPEQFFDAMPTWMASLVLAVEDMSKDGLSHADGVEAVLQKAFTRAGRPILAVEDGSAVLRHMHGLSEAAQRKMLEDTLADMDATKPDAANESDRAWAAGDVSQLDADFTEEKLGAELYNVLVKQRNLAWTRWLTTRMAKPGTVLFAVGAGHLAGPDSLQRLLNAEGIAVARVD